MCSDSEGVHVSKALVNGYSLRRLEVRPKQLLLDPRNPRLLEEFAQVRDYSDAEVARPEVQKWVHARISAHEHHVTHLLASIERMGFIGGLHEMIVKKVGAGLYLVLEGNRRTAALQTLIRTPSRVSSDVLGSIEKIDVKEFIYSPQSGMSEDEVIDLLLGTIHIDGPQEWGALEKAHYILRNYSREIDEDGYGDGFFFDGDAAKRVASNFNMKSSEVRKCLTTSRVYRQLKECYPDTVKPDLYTLIDLATKTRAVAQPYFELDPSDCQLSDEGLERFAELCVEADRPVHNPPLFRQFAAVFKEGTPHELAQIVGREWTVAHAYSRVQARKNRRAFLSSLEDIRERIQSLVPDDYRGTRKEVEEITRIEKLVRDRLRPLARRGRV